jgi:hypothetical protein
MDRNRDEASAHSFLIHTPTPKPKTPSPTRHSTLGSTAFSGLLQVQATQKFEMQIRSTVGRRRHDANITLKIQYSRAILIVSGLRVSEATLMTENFVRLTFAK